METELDRVRAFYKKKVEDLQRKSEAQIRALKRGDALPTASDATAAAAVPPPPAPSELAQQQMQQLEELQKLTDHYSERIAMLEGELMATAAELGKVKAAAEATGATPSSTSAPAAPPAPPASSALSATADISDAELRRRVGDEVLRERERLDAAHRQQMAELRTSHREHVQQLQRQWDTERDGLLARLKDEQERYSQQLQLLQQRSMHSLPTQAVAFQHTPVVEMKTPEMSQFQMMEQQVEHLEQRLKRRERELTGAIEDARAAQKMELARLQALHAQVPALQ